MADDLKTELELRRLPCGGFVVVDTPGIESGRYREALFASTTIDEALQWMRLKIVGENKGFDIFAKYDKTEIGP
jgi:hypothetical protein